MNIKVEIVADSKGIYGDRLTSMLVTFPRIILSQFNTHRMFSKNTSSSRAIPFSKMLKSVMDNPFIPIAWQKDHKGMQGTEYLDPTKLYHIDDFVESLSMLSENSPAILSILKFIDKELFDIKRTLPDWWLYCRDNAVKSACVMHSIGITKQLCNRLLEPFMWTTMLVTSTDDGWNNFFSLRCPEYTNTAGGKFRSKKDFKKSWYAKNIGRVPSSDLGWLEINKGQGEIHIMDLAEKIYDAMNESVPKQLEEGEYHIPMIEVIED